MIKLYIYKEKRQPDETYELGIKNMKGLRDLLIEDESDISAKCCQRCTIPHYIPTFKQSHSIGGLGRARGAPAGI